MTVEEKIVITSEDVAGPGFSPSFSSGIAHCIPVWKRILSVLLLLCPPLLFLVVICGLFKTRHRDVAVRQVFALHYCWLLLASGILLTVFLITLFFMTPRTLIEDIAPPSTLSFHTFPSLPSARILSGKDIAQQLSPLVVVVHHQDRTIIPSRGVMQSFGGGAVAFAGQDGCLVITSRHVVDALSRSSQLGSLVGVTMQDGQQADAAVVGMHRSLDLALLWVESVEVQTYYAQPLREFKTVDVGEQVYVIGHPEGLMFSLSGGLVAQTRGEDMIQLSAPVSPGNSGGPVYDVHGRLIAIVQSVIDKTKSPNAENLNFAVRVDDLLNYELWTLSKEGHAAVIAFAATDKPDEDEHRMDSENGTNMKGN